MDKESKIIKLNDKGYTLTELVIVIAVISIISFMVVTFSLFISGINKKTKCVNKLCDDINFVQNEFNSFINKYDDERYTFVVDNNLIIIIENNEEIDELNIEELKNKYSEITNIEIYYIINTENYIGMDIYYDDNLQTNSIRYFLYLRCSLLEVNNE